MSSSTPAYDDAQSAFHRAFEPELFAILDALPLPTGGSVLDVPCGSGFYARRLAERVDGGGRLTAVDNCDAYLTQARERLAGLPADVRKGDAYNLPFGNGSFDLVLSAQSLISLDPRAAVREMARVVKPSGTVAVLEGDEFHHLLLPWPVELEVALPAAVLAGSRAKYGDGVKLSPARRLRQLLHDAGFTHVRRFTSTADRAAPFPPPALDFLRAHLDQLRELVYWHLPPHLRTQFDTCTDPDAGYASLFHGPDAEFTCLNAVFLASSHLPRS